MASAKRNELIHRLLAGRCEICESTVGLQVHHIRKLADLNQARPPGETRLDAPHGHAATQDPRDLPSLPRGHPRRAGHQALPEMITGERGAGKLARPVREEADGKGPTPRAPRRRPTSLGERAGETHRGQPRHRAPGRPNWRHTRRGDKYVTVIIDLTPVRAGTGPARLLDMIPGRSKAAFKAWLTQRPQAWREAVEVVAMDGFTGFKTAAAEEIPAAVAVMDPFHVVRLAGDALNYCRRRVQQTTRGRRGRKNDPLYRARRTLHTGADLLTDKQAARLTALFAIDEHVEVEATWGIYQRMIAAYRHPDPAAGRELMVKLIESLSAGVPRPLVEIAKLGRTLSKRAADVLAYFDRPGTSNGPTEAINGRLEHLRGSALGFRNLTNYIARSLLETGGFRPRLHPALVKSRSSWGSAKDTTETGNQ